MALLKHLIIITLLGSFPAKALFHYLHIKQTQPSRLRRFTDYLYALPVLDDYKSNNKNVANMLVAYIYALIIILLLVNYKFIISIIKDWENIP